MKALEIILKLLLILLTVLVMLSPLLGEIHTFRRDQKKDKKREKEKQISYKRFRIVVFTALYMIAVTVALILLRDTVSWLEDRAFVRWLIRKLALSTRTAYYGKLLVVMLVNFAVGALYQLLSKLVRIGLKRKNLLTPDEDGEFTRRQKWERSVIRFFHTETWFFVARLLRYLSITLTVVYGLVFAVYQLPALFGSEKIPFSFISTLFEAGYLYPMITLLGLWQMYFFLSGLQAVQEQCPEILQDEQLQITLSEADLDLIDQRVREVFGTHYACNVELAPFVRDDTVSGRHDPISGYIAQAVEKDRRNPSTAKELYMDCVDKLLQEDKSLLIRGNFQSEFAAYFLRYLSAVAARGDNLVFVCNSEDQIDGIYGYIVQGLSEISSLYCTSGGKEAVDFDDPIWRVGKVSGENSTLADATAQENNILVTSLGYLCSDRFADTHNDFVSLIDTVVFVDTLNTVNAFSHQMSILNARLKHIARSNASRAGNGDSMRRYPMRYLSRRIRYICFDDTRVAGLEDVLENMLASEFQTIDAMKYHANTIVRCYNYEPRANAEGRAADSDVTMATEKLGVLMNMAITCLSMNASSVTVFLDDLVPYKKLRELVDANNGTFTARVDAEKIRINRPFYDPKSYSVIIAMDSGDNLPTALRKYIAMASEEPTLILLFSRAYMLRDYYVDHAAELLSLRQIERVPFAQGTKRDAARKILIKANYGGITREEILQIAHQVAPFAPYVQKKDVDSILRAVLEEYGESQESRLELYQYFEYSVSHTFGPDGKLRKEDKVVLRRRGRLFDRINAWDMVSMHTDMGQVQLPVPRSRLRQNYIAGQNLVYNGDIYYIKSVDVQAGRIDAALAVSDDEKQPYRYVQAREYRVVAGQEEKAFLSKHAQLGDESADIRLDEVSISAFRAPMEVLVHGYYPVNPNSLAPTEDYGGFINISKPGDDELAKQTYRRYGRIEQPYYSSDTMFKTVDHVGSVHGALMMSIRISGQFGPDVNKTMALAATMLNELMHSMFPSAADSLAVCPVLHQPFTDDQSAAVLNRQPRLTLVGESELFSKTDFELLIIEDCEEDLGVVSSLMSSGSDILYTLFSPIYAYLKWYTSAKEKSTYLHCGKPEQPACYDFDALYRVSSLLGDTARDSKYVDLDTLVEWESCDFCGKRFPKNGGMAQLEDGRKMCRHCAENLVGNNKKALKAHLEQAKRFLENTYGIRLDDDYEFCFESTVKIANTLKHNRELMGRGGDLPLKSYVDADKKVHIEYSVPSVNLSELLVRELTHVWQLKHIPDVEEDLAEGHIALVGIQYLRFLNENALAGARTHYYESSTGISGEGYRKLVRQLLLKPQYRNNPFLYLLEACGAAESLIPKPTPRKPIEESELGPQYTPETTDRTTGGAIPYFYYPRLTTSQQALYDVILAAVKAHAPTACVEDYDPHMALQMSDAVAFDHPELFFWLRNVRRVHNGQLVLDYGASAEESELLQLRIDEEAAKYLEGIEETMSAYDVAVRLHAKIIGMADYDTLALNEEEKKGGPADGKVDYLRTICGVFLDKKAVCEGYARALQYLLQKCGIECGEAAGLIRKENGQLEGGHAWNIVKIDGDYYYIDSTWDDSSSTVQTVRSTDTGFTYFCITTQELLRSRDLSYCPVDMPECTATRANYYYHNGLVLSDYDLDRIQAFAKAAAEARHTSFTFKFDNRAAFDKAFQRICVDGEDGFRAVRAAAKVDKRIDPGSYTPGFRPLKDVYTITVYFRYKE